MGPRQARTGRYISMSGRNERAAFSVGRDEPVRDEWAEKECHLHLSILDELGRSLSPDAVILDFGCGDGRLVRGYRRMGFQAFGVDVRLDAEHEFLSLMAPGPTHSRIPFPDNTFDFIVSTSVVEHVEDLDAALSEMHRVLKPGGMSLHRFPPLCVLVEPHMFVPLAESAAAVRGFSSGRSSGSEIRFRRT